MKPKTVIQVALLAFVALSIIFFVNQQSRRSAVEASTSSGSQPSLNSNTQSAKVIVYYFHGNFRCVSCRKLEAVSRQAVTSGFSGDLKHGDLQWQTVNVEQAGNEHFASDYHLFSRSLVIVRFKDGKQVEYKTLEKAWELLNDDEALTKYVQSEVRDYLQKS